MSTKSDEYAGDNHHVRPNVTNPMLPLPKSKVTAFPNGESIHEATNVIAESPCEVSKRFEVMNPSDSNDRQQDDTSAPNISMDFVRASNEPLLDMDDVLKTRYYNREETDGLLFKTGECRKRPKAMDSSPVHVVRDCSSDKQMRLLQEALAAANKELEVLKFEKKGAA